MIITVDTDRACIAIGDAGALDTLSACVKGSGSINAALGSAGRADTDGQHLWVDVARLRSLAAVGQDGRWSERFDAMIAYAARQGWTDAACGQVRVHLE